MSTNHTFIIAEVGQAHDGSLGMLHAYIDAVAGTGADAIKFQTHIADAESSEYEPFRVNFSYQDDSRYDYWQRMTFTPCQWQEIKQHCDSVGLEFLSTPFSIAAVNLLESLGIKQYKIGSGDLANYLLLDSIADTQKPIILSTGMASYEQIQQTLDYLALPESRLTLMQCTTQYPTPLSQVGLNNLNEYQQRFGIKVGLSDHSGTIYPAAIAATMGAVAVENHIVFDKRMFGPDTSSSLTIEEMKSLVDFIRAYEEMNANPVDKSNSEAFSELSQIFGRSLAVNKNLAKGHVLSKADLETKKPYGKGLDPKEYKKIIGTRINKNIDKNQFIQAEDIN